MSNARFFRFAAVLSAVTLAAAPMARAQQGVSLPVLKTTLPASWDESWFGSPAVYDLDGDGAMEIIAARHSVLYVWKASGALAWRAAVGKDGTTDEVHGNARQYAAPVVGDFDGVRPEGGTAKGEIAIAYGMNIAVYDAEGKLLPGWPKTMAGTGEIRSLAAADLDKDGKLEILAVKSGKGPTTMAYTLAGTPAPGWPQLDTSGCDKCYEYGGYNQNVGAADLDKDGKPDVVATYDASYIGIFHGDGKPMATDPSFTPKWAAGVPMFHDIALAKQGWGADGKDRDEFTESPPAFADLDGDGAPEIILYSNHEKAGDTAQYGNCLWALHGDMTRAKGFETPLCSDAPIFTGYYNNVVQTVAAAAVGNLSGDARPEIVVSSLDGTIRGYGPEGAALWKYTYDVAGEPWIMASEPVIGDLNQDGSPEIVFTTYSVDQGVSHLTILDAQGRMQRKAPLDKRGAMGPPTLADVDGDKKLDIVVTLKDVVGTGNGGVQIWTVASAGDAEPLWPTGRGNFQRTGVGKAGTGPTSISIPKKKNLGRISHGRSATAGWVDLLGSRASTRSAPAYRLLYRPAP